MIPGILAVFLYPADSSISGEKGLSVDDGLGSDKGLCRLPSDPIDQIIV